MESLKLFLMISINICTELAFLKLFPPLSTRPANSELKGMRRRRVGRAFRNEVLFCLLKEAGLNNVCSSSDIFPTYLRP